MQLVPLRDGPYTQKLRNSCTSNRNTSPPQKQEETLSKQKISLYPEQPKQIDKHNQTEQTNAFTLSYLFSKSQND
jgi:hypothetical protein